MVGQGAAGWAPGDATTGPLAPADTAVPDGAVTMSADASPGSSGPHVAVAVMGGESHTCAVTAEGLVRCWGRNQVGQLGQPPSETPAPTPATVPGLTGVAAVSAGAGHSCAIVAGGEVWCWGWNVSGQLGNGTYANAAVPSSDTKARDIYGALAITSAGAHTCAIDAARSLKCWGGYFRTGGDWVQPRLTPEPALVSAATVGINHRCAISGGVVSCWGSGRTGAITGELNVDAAAPAPIRNLPPVVQVTVGGSTTCALIHDGTVYCWGGEYTSPLEAGNQSPGPVKIPGVSKGVAIAGGFSHRCVLDAEGLVWCWGAGLGQLSPDNSEAAYVPTVIPGLARVAAIGAGGSHTCAVLVDGALRCWGDNRFGQLGNGSHGFNERSTTPVPVLGFGR